jgi:ornithine cyclodeaminase/alanine dehydrogenase-like protein (mu-crystallin family)
MNVLIVTQSEIPALLPMHECIDVMAEVLETLARGDAVLPLRKGTPVPDGTGYLVVMPGYIGAPAALGLKAISVFPGNLGTEYDSHQGAVLLFEPVHGRLLAIMDASTITGIRTAAVSGLATRLLSKADAGDLAILGSGVQAHSHLDAMRCARKLRRVRVWSRNTANARRFADNARRDFDIDVEVADHPKNAVLNADIICTTTSSAEPVLQGGWLSSGAHINAVGSSVARARELDTEAVVRSRMFVDRMESALNEAGDFLTPKQEGAIGDNHIIGELGDILLGKLEGRRNDREITLFKSLGLAVEDLASAHHIYSKAVAEKTGTWIDFGGSRHL